VLHAAGPYRCDHLRIRGKVVRTNTPPNGAFRGFGVPQSCFALERHLDVVASKLKLDPAAFRQKNLLRDGETTATGQAVVDAGESRKALDAALKAAGWANKKKEHAAFNATSRYTRRGIGLASFFHGTGFTGGGELYLMSEAGVAVTPEGSMVVLAASTEIGQGTRTVFSQIVADTLGLPFGMVDVADPDTANVPDSGPTVASRTVAVVGRIVADAAKMCGDALAAHAGFDRATPWSEARFRQAAKKWIADGKDPRFIAKFGNPAKQVWNEKTYQGDAYGAYAWACVVAEVEVDLLTFEVTTRNMVSAQEIGKAIHPRLAEGQIEGGTTQALGWALMEDVVMKDGRMANGQLTNYIIPTTIETPPIRVVTLERPYAHGPFGAKGIGELPMDGGAPAILNAIHDAIGLSIDRIPATPERLLAAWLAAGRKPLVDEIRDRGFAPPRKAKRASAKRAR
jgi:CO/xanthine dehydrogenase Mo-binding subunit